MNVGQPVTLFTFILELPYGLPIPSGASSVTLDKRNKHWAGWSDDLIGRILTRDENPLPAGFVPATRIVVRHVEVNEWPGLLTAEDAFGGWIEHLFSEKEATQRRQKREEWREAGIQVMKSVIALTRFLPRSAHPRGEEITGGWLVSEFRRALGDFNGIAEALGFVLDRWNIGAVTPRDLPAMIPVLIESTHLGAEERPQGITFVARLHDAVPALAQTFAPERAPVEAAARISNEGRWGVQPFMLVFRYLHAATGERLAGDLTRAVIDLNTAIEILVSVTLNEAGPIAGLTAQEIQNANEAGIKQKVRRYLAKVFDEEIDIEDETTFGAGGSPTAT